jgi:hypothetical protein
MLYGDAIYVMGTRTESGWQARMIMVRPLPKNTSSGGDRTGMLDPSEPL